MRKVIYERVTITTTERWMELHDAPLPPDDPVLLPAPDVFAMPTRKRPRRTASKPGSRGTSAAQHPSKAEEGKP